MAVQPMLDDGSIPLTCDERPTHGLPPYYHPTISSGGFGGEVVYPQTMSAPYPMNSAVSRSR